METMTERSTYKTVFYSERISEKLQEIGFCPVSVNHLKTAGQQFTACVMK